MAIDKLKDLASLSDTDLHADLESMKLAYQKLRFDHSVKGLDNPLDLRDMRRNIARLNTELRKRELANATGEELAARDKIRARRRK